MMARVAITVIEPRFAQRLLYEWELVEEGYEVASYARPADALADHDRGACELVLVDGGNQVPVALEQVHKVRTVFPDATVVVHTASRAVAEACPPTLADAILLKSPDLTALRLTVQSLLAETCPAGAGEMPEIRDEGPVLTR